MKMSKASVYRWCRTCLVALVGFAVVSGCSPFGRPDFVEYLDKRIDRVSPTRVLLLSHGASRVDIRLSDDGCLHTVLIPASRSEVQRLVRVVGTIDALAVEEPLHFNDLRVSPDPVLVFSSRWNGRERSLATWAAQPNMFFVVDGIFQEINLVGSVDLARAIVYQQTAERKIAKGDLDDAIMWYNRGVSDFLEWGDVSGKRIGSTPERLPGLFPKTTIGNDLLQLTAKGLARAKELKQQSMPDRQVAIEALRQTWQDLTQGIGTSQSGDVTTVEFTSVACGISGVSDTPTRLSGDIVEELRGLQLTPSP
jgi:hypothetical protein